MAHAQRHTRTLLSAQLATNSKAKTTKDKPAACFDGQATMYSNPYQPYRGAPQQDQARGAAARGTQQQRPRHAAYDSDQHQAEQRSHARRTVSAAATAPVLTPATRQTQSSNVVGKSIRLTLGAVVCKVLPARRVCEPVIILKLFLSSGSCELQCDATRTAFRHCGTTRDDEVMIG